MSLIMESLGELLPSNEKGNARGSLGEQVVCDCVDIRYIDYTCY
jgi:hypothetical protein